MSEKYQFPKIMGILNVTPDSFSDGGRFFDKNRAIDHALDMLDSGADIIDVGGESTRPGADDVSITNELARTIPVIEGIVHERPETIISIDTTKAEVAESALSCGASIINDISGLDYCPELAMTAARYDAGLIVMHMQGKPRTMQKNPVYTDVVKEVSASLREKIEKARAAGVKNVIADAGIGFGKTLVHNLELLRHHEEFNSLGVPLLLGICRKSFIGELLGIEQPEERDVPTALIHALMLSKKIDIIRVHNPKIFLQLKILYNSIT